MTADEFRHNETLRDDLAAILASTVLQQAIGILKAELEPTPGNAEVGNPVAGAARYQQIAGANHIILGLGKLTNPPVQRTALKGKVLLPDPIRDHT